MVIVMRPITRTIKRADAFTRHDVVLETNTCINAGCRTLLSTSLMANHAPRLKVNDDSTIAASLRRRSCRCSRPPGAGSQSSNRYYGVILSFGIGIRRTRLAAIHVILRQTPEPGPGRPVRLH